MAKVLIVEDDPTLAEEIRGWLELDRHTCDVSAFGRAAVEYCERSLIDLLVLDWELPDISGVQVLKMVSESRNPRPVPVLMLTGKSRTEDMIQGLDSGADDYLTKPFSGEVLLAKVRALLRRQYEESAAVYTYADLVLEESSREARAGSAKLKLTPSEFACLVYLIQQANRAPISVDAMLSRVWNGSERSSADGVKSCIYQLRSKLRSAQSSSFIIMKHGYGYMLSEKPSGDDED
jgi:DNA-binding response OmpR family regulator